MSVDAFPLHYDALGIEESSTYADIRAAWHAIAHRDHPDKTKSARSASRFQRASVAWGVLRDPDARMVYDEELWVFRTPRCIVCGGPSPHQGICSLCALATPRNRPPPRPSAAAPMPPTPPTPPTPKTPATPATPANPKKPPKPPRAPRPPKPPKPQAPDPIDSTRTWDDINGVVAPDGDSLLEALLADAALRSAVKPRSRKSRLEVHVAPGFTVALEGEAADTLKGVNRNLKLASRILNGVSRFFGG